VAGSSPASGSNAGVAQKEEHFRGKEEVAGSNPATSSILLKLWLPAQQEGAKAPFECGRGGSWRIVSQGCTQTTEAHKGQGRAYRNRGQTRGQDRGRGCPSYRRSPVGGDPAISRCSNSGT